MRVGDTEVRLVGIDRQQQQQHRSRGAPGLRLPPFPSPFPSPSVGCDLSSVGLCAGDGWHGAKIRPRSPRSGSVYTNGPAKTSPSTARRSGLVWPGLASPLAWHVPFIVRLENTPSASFPAAKAPKRTLERRRRNFL